MTRSILAALTVAVLAAAAPACAQEAPAVPLPSTVVGQRASALLAAIRAGDEGTVRRFFDEHVDPAFRDQFPMAEHVAVFRQMHDEVGEARVVRFQPEGTERAALDVRSPRTGAVFTVQIGLAAEAPHRITDLGFRPAGEVQADAPPASPEMSPVQRRAAVDSIAALVERRYVHADTGRMIAAHLRGRQAAGAYDRFTTFPQLADTLTEDLRAVNGDRHLNVRFNRGAGRGGPRPGGPGPNAGSDFGIRAERLEGNVGYVKLAVVPGAPRAFEVMADALRSLEGTGAVIVDLRGTPGGSAEMANFLISHFTPPSVVSLGVFRPDRQDTTWRATLGEVPGPRRLDVPLYVLVDGGSASAAEDIPFVLQNLRRATIVGERTAGAGRNNEIVSVGNGLSVSISRTVVFEPKTGREWERVGVRPDVEVPSAGALEAAHAAARRAIAGRAASR